MGTQVENTGEKRIVWFGKEKTDKPKKTDADRNIKFFGKAKASNVTVPDGSIEIKEGEVNETKPVKTKKGELTEAEQKFVNNVSTAQEEKSKVSAVLTPADLDAIVNEIEDEDLKAKLQQSIDEVKAADKSKYPEMKKKSKDPILNKVLEVYIDYEVSEAQKQLVKYLLYDKTENISLKIDNLKEGKYYDAEGNVQEIGHKYPEGPYEKAALQSYYNEILPVELEMKLNRILLKLESEGKLNGKSNGDIVDMVIEADKAARTDGKKDKIFETYVKNNKKDMVAIVNNHNKVMQRREELKHISLEDIKKQLNSNTYESIKDYIEAHKITDGEHEGKYDLSGLSVLIEDYVGQDLCANLSKDIDASEFENTRVAIRTLEGVDKDNFDKRGGKYKQTKDLIKFCEYDIEKRKRFSWLDIGLGAAGGAVTGAAVPAFATSLRELTAIQVVNYNGTPLAVQIADGIIPLTQGLLDAVAVGAVSGIVLAVLYDAIFGKDVPFETTCVTKGIDPKIKENKNDFVAFMKENRPEQYERIKSLLALYEADENGNWDHEKFFAVLNRIGGYGSNINCREVKSARVYNKPELVKTHISTPGIETGEEFDETEDKFTEGVERTTWSHMIKTLYNCTAPSLLDIYPKESDAIRVLKLAQCITDHNYTKDRMDELLAMSKRNNGAELRNLSYFDANKYFTHTETIDGREVEVKGVLASPVIKEVKLPKDLAGAKRCEPVTPDMFDARIEWDGNNFKGATSTPYYDQYDNRVKTEGTEEYKVGVVNGGSKSFKTQDEANEYEQNLMKTLNTGAATEVEAEEFDKKVKTPAK